MRVLLLEWKTETDAIVMIRRQHFFSMIVEERLGDSAMKFERPQQGYGKRQTPA